MQANKKIIILIAILILVGIALYLILDKKDQVIINDAKSQTSLIEHNNYSETDKDSVEELTISSKSNNTEKNRNTSFINIDNFNDILESGAKNNGVVYISLNSLDPKTKQEVKAAIENLNERGSLSGGLKLKEFSDLDKARENLAKEGINKIISQLDDFKGTSDEIFKDFKLTGAQNFGRYDAENGWNGLYKLYENDSQKIEIEQMHLKPGESSQQLIIEALNQNLKNDTPAIYEKLNSDLIEKITFVSDYNYYQINGYNLKNGKILDIANNIIQN